METETKIRRMYFVTKLTIKDISRQLKLSRNTIRRAIRAKCAGETYQRQSSSEPKMGPFKSILEKWLSEDHKLPRKERRNATGYFSELKSQGYQGAYDSVQRIVKHWRLTHKESLAAFIPLSFSPGEAYQFDWSTETIELDGIVKKLKVAQFRLCYSRKFFLVAYSNEKQEMLFDAHNRAFVFFDGLCTRGIYDNMKTAVVTASMKKEPVFNKRFLLMMDHYLIEPTACNPSSGWEKGQVENQVDNIRGWVFKPRLKFKNLIELNVYLHNKCQELAKKHAHPEMKQKKIEEVFTEEKSHLRQLPDLFDCYSERSALVSSTCLVTFDKNRYSVDCYYANKTVSVRVYATSIQVFFDNKNIASHTREFSSNKTISSPWHYLSLLDRKPGALRNGLPFKDWELPAPILDVKNILMKRKGGDRECVDILLGMREHGIEAVTVACELALTDKVISRDYIVNALNRLKLNSNPESIETPDGLKLKQEPTSNCSHYNSLLQESQDAI